MKQIKILLFSSLFLTFNQLKDIKISAMQLSTVTEKLKVLNPSVTEMHGEDFKNNRIDISKKTIDEKYLSELNKILQKKIIFQKAFNNDLTDYYNVLKDIIKNINKNFNNNEYLALIKNDFQFSKNATNDSSSNYELISVKISNMESKIDVLNKTSSLLNNKIEELNNFITEKLISKKYKIVNLNQKMINERSENKKAIENIQKQLEDSLKQLTEKNKEIVQIKQQLESEKSKHEKDLEAKDSEHKNAMSNAQKQLTEKNKEIVQIKQQLETEKSKHEKDLEAKDSEIAEVKEQLKSKERMLEEMNKHQERLKNEHITLTEQTKTMLYLIKLNMTYLITKLKKLEDKKSSFSYKLRLPKSKKKLNEQIEQTKKDINYITEQYDKNLKEFKKSSLLEAYIEKFESGTCPLCDRKLQ